MSDSEDDYMSDAFLAKCQDSRPGLVPDKIARQHRKEIRIKEKNKKYQTKPLKVLEQEKRSEGLKQAIGEENKGFSLMQKMGYAPGMALGKKGTGRAEPVPIKVRIGRGGLGEDTERKRKQEEVASMRVAMMLKRKRQEVTAHKDFRAENSKKMQERQAEADLYRSQRVCEQLDEEKGIEEPEATYFWTPAKRDLLVKQLERDEQSDEEDVTCVDMMTERKDCLRLQPLGSEDDDSCHENLPDDAEEELPPTIEQLETLTKYLRTEYLYCVWCGTRFEDSGDFSQNCPGDTSDAHDS